MTQVFIKELIAKNPDAAYGKKGRWEIIVLEYIKQYPHSTNAKILKGLELTEGSSAGGSALNTVRKLYNKKVLVRSGWKPYQYTWNPAGWLPNN